MDIRKPLICILFAAQIGCPQAIGQFPGTGSGGGGGEPAANHKTDDGTKKDEAGSGDSFVPMPPTELDLSVDDRIKVKVEPFVVGSLVDRIVEPSVIVIDSPGAAEVEVFVVPVDAPYGGKAIEKPHSVGKDERSADGFKINWVAKEHDPYVKLFVVAKRKNSQHRVRSHTLDFGMSGARFEAPIKKEE